MTPLRRPSEPRRAYREPAFDAAAVADEVLARDLNDRGSRRRPPSPTRRGELVRTGGGVHTEQQEVGRDGTVEGGGTVYLRTEITAAPGIAPHDVASVVDQVMGTATAPHPRRTTR